MTYNLRTMHQHPWFFEVMASSVAGWLLGTIKGFSTSADWLARYLPSRPVVVVFAIDVVVFVIFGAYFGTGIFQPHDFVSALAAGLSWPIGLGALASKDT